MTRQRPVWSDDQEAAVRALRDAGTLNAIIAERMGISLKRFYHCLRSSKLPRRDPHVTSTVRWDKSRIANLQRRLDDRPTPTYTRLAHEFGCTKNAIAGAISRHCWRQEPERSTAVVIEFPYNVCMWPEGHPNEPGFHFCGARPASGKPYCEMHAAIAYVRPKPTEDKAAAMS
jgi:hypothetical protein